MGILVPTIVILSLSPSIGWEGTWEFKGAGAREGESPSHSIDILLVGIYLWGMVVRVSIRNLTSRHPPLPYHHSDKRKASVTSNNNN